MTGDKLKELEKGFLEGSLNDQEEEELKAWVLMNSDHHLNSYFSWTSNANEIDLPDFRAKLHTTAKRRTFSWLKVAATVLVLATAGFLFSDRFAVKPKSYTEAEIEESYQATMETLSAMSSFLDQQLSTAQKAMDLSMPFEQLNKLKDQKPK